MGAAAVPPPPPPPFEPLATAPHAVVLRLNNVDMVQPPPLKKQRPLVQDDDYDSEDARRDSTFTFTELPSTAPRKQYMCSHCKVPMKGHVCAHRKSGRDRKPTFTVSPDTATALLTDTQPSPPSFGFRQTLTAPRACVQPAVIESTDA